MGLIQKLYEEYQYNELSIRCFFWLAVELEKIYNFYFVTHWKKLDLFKGIATLF